MTKTYDIEPTPFQTAWDAPMSTRGHLSVSKYGVKFSGLDTGELTLIDHKVIPGLGTILVVHEKGSSYWVGRGMSQGYSGAAVHTLWVEQKEDPQRYRYVKLTSVPVKTSEDAREQRHEAILVRLGVA